MNNLYIQIAFQCEISVVSSHCYLFLKAQHVNLIPVVEIPKSMNFGDK